MFIREATKDDLDEGRLAEIEALMNAGFAAEGDDCRFSVPSFRGFWEPRVGLDGAIFFLVDPSGATRGIITGLMANNFTIGENQAVIANWRVDPALRGTGWGYGLLDAFERWGKARGARTVLAHCSTADEKTIKNLARNHQPKGVMFTRVLQGD